jgi:hypothetical protein
MVAATVFVALSSATGSSQTSGGFVHATPADFGAGAFPGPGLPARMPPAGSVAHSAGPDPGDIWLQVPIPRETVMASPPGSRAWPGIVNLESWFWGEPLPDAQATFVLDNYAVAVVAHPIAYAWSFGDGSTAVGPTAGAPQDPARASFRRRGDYGVALFVVWEGRARTTALEGHLSFDQDLGTVTIRERIVYHEAEIRAVLRSRTAGR